MLIQQRQYAWQQGNKPRYKVIRNQVQREASKLRRKYYSKHVHSLRRSGPRQWWSEVKKLTGQSSTCPLNTIADRLYGGDMQQMAEDINKIAPLGLVASLLDQATQSCSTSLRVKVIIGVLRSLHTTS